MSENNLGKRIVFGINMLFQKDNDKTLETSDFMAVWTNIVLLPAMWLNQFTCESEHTKAGYDREQAVLYGMLVRSYKTLMMERKLVLAGLMNHQFASTLTRILLEDNVNFQYYIRHREKIDDFCKSSAKAEMKFANYIDQKKEEHKDKWTEVQLKWEEGLFDSVMRGMETAGVSMGEKLPQTPSMMEKIRGVGLEDFYISYQLKCHAVHGDWFDIAKYNMKEIDGKYYPQFEVQGIDIRELNMILTIVYKSLKEFIAMYPGHGIARTITRELDKDQQIIENFDTMFFNFRHHLPIITGLEDKVEIGDITS